MDDVDLTTKHVAGLGGELEEQQSIDRQPLLGHGGNYEWLFGVLQRVHVPKKGWKLRYAPLDLKDRWGGSVVPAPDIRIDSFEEGDNVYVEGEIIDDRASLYLSGPRYRINSIRRVEQEDYRRVAEGR